MFWQDVLRVFRVYGGEHSDVSEPAFLGTSQPCPVVPAVWYPAACHLPVLSTLQVTLARCGRGGVRKWSSLRSVFQGFNVSCRSGQASSQAFGADPGARGVRREEMELAEAEAGTSPVASDPVTAVQVPRGAVPSKQG